MVSEATLDALLSSALARLEAALGLPAREALLEARVLAARALGVERAWLFAHGNDGVDEPGQRAFEALLARRLRGEPVAHILGGREFFGLDLRITPEVLIPRPETELLVEAALARLPVDAPVALLDLCTGSGAVAIALARSRPRSCVTATDLSAAALAVARANGADHAVVIEWLQGDLFAPLSGRRFDLVVGNPPYIAAADPHLAQGDVRFEPRLALVGGPLGTEILARIVREAPAHLDPGGWLLLEHGYDQGEPCRALFEAAGFSAVETLHDLAGVERVTVGRHR